MKNDISEERVSEKLFRKITAKFENRKVFERVFPKCWLGVRVIAVIITITS